MLSRRPRTRFLAPAALAVSAVALAGCGGATTSGSSSSSSIGAAGTDGLAAQAFPSTSLAYIDANIDQGSAQWKKMEALGARFPAWPKLVANLRKELNAGSGGVTFSRDVEPWLGGEAGLAVTSVRPAPNGNTSPVYVGFAASKDDAKLSAALTRSGDNRPTGTYKGYSLYRSKKASNATFSAVGHDALLASNDRLALRQAIDTRQGSGSSLAGVQRFKDALAKLPKNNLVVGYVDGPGLQQLVSLGMAQAQAQGATGGLGSSQLGGLRKQVDALRGAAFSIGAEDHGFRFRGAALLDPAKAKQAGLDQGTFDPSLLQDVPGSAFAYVGMKDLGPMLKRTLDQVEQTPGVGQQVQGVEQQTGVSIDNDLVPLLTGENALYLATGAPFSAGLLLHPPSADAGAASLRKLTKAIGQMVPGVTFTPLPTGDGERATAGSSGLSVLWRQTGDVIAISNDPTAGQKQSPSLADSADFTRVRKEAGQNGAVSSLLYVDVPGAIDFAASVGAPIQDQQTAANVKHVGPLLAWSTSSTSEATAEAFLEIR